MRDQLWLVAVMLVVYGYAFWIVYLLVTKPATFVEWMVRRPYRGWGLNVVVEDEAKLTRMSRLFGILMGLGAVAHATVVCWAITSGKR